MQFQCQTIALLAQRHLARDARAQRDLRVAGSDALGECLRRVVRDVQHRLDELLAIGGELGQAEVVVGDDADRRKLGEDQAAHAFEHVVEVDRGRAHHAMRTQQAVHQVLQAVGLGDDDVGEFAQLRVVELVLQQLGRAADAAERVLDLVREVADELAVGLLLVQQLLLARDAQLRVDRAEFEQQAHACGVDRRHRAVEPQRLGVAALHADVLAGVAPVGAQRVVERRGQAGRAAEQAFERLAEQLAPADREQVLRARVEVADHQPGVDEHDRRRQQVESGERAAGAAGGVGGVRWHGRVLLFGRGHARSAPGPGHRRPEISRRSASTLRLCNSTRSLKGRTRSSTFW
ncbi:MAG: hypothetical protein BWZ09_01707 [Alphaproteobacteria bacterium ADurb.BinA305]|nr:MAG: hypothetical protein BWZ09_01707 [Alphaproteobacteria bacterium ADurb.BinA305]